MNNVKEGTLLASTSQGYTVLLASAAWPTLCSCLVRNERIQLYQVLSSDGHFASSAGIYYSNNLKERFQAQHEVWSVKTVPYGVTWRVCQNVSPQPVSFTVSQPTASSQEVNWRRWGKDWRNIDWYAQIIRLHLTNDFMQKLLSQGSLFWCVNCNQNPNR